MLAVSLRSLSKHGTHQSQSESDTTLAAEFPAEDLGAWGSNWRLPRQDSW